MSDDTFPWRSRRALLLLIPLAVSGFPWILPLAFSRAKPVEYEGDGLVMAFCGILSFLLTAPLTGVVLAALARKRKLTIWRFACVYCLVSLPALAFQVYYNSLSIAPIVLGPHANGGQFAISATLLCTSFYTAYLGVLYLTAKSDFRWTFIAAALLFCGTFVITAAAIVH